MKFISTKYRSSEPEIMDSFNFRGKKLRDTLGDLERINKFLGGNRASLRGIEKLNICYKKTIHIADIGCGSGAMLREIAKWGRRKNLKLKLTGIDANENTLKIAKKSSLDFPEISFIEQNLFSETFQKSTFDVVCFSLTLHHFTTPEINSILKTLKTQTRIGIVINDLHRSKTAYYLFRLFCFLTVKNDVAKNDGLISILRGFKRKELIQLSEGAQLNNYEINWCWAFRYQWIVRTNQR